MTDTLEHYLRLRPVPTLNEEWAHGTVNANVWIIFNRDSGGGDFQHWSVSNGMLTMMMDQPAEGEPGTGCELQSINLYRYGYYECLMRPATDSADPFGAGNCYPGSVSSFFTYYDGDPDDTHYPYSEMDVIEVEGQFPHQAEFTNWTNPYPTAQDHSFVRFKRLTDDFHKVGALWLPGSISYYVDGLLCATHTNNVPDLSAHILANLWATDSTDFGGVRTPGVTRYSHYQYMRFYED